jgi:serine/threonine protein kinase
MGDARVGDLIAGYRIERELGRGGMSVVYLADHERLERKVALKVLAPQLAGNQKFRERFLRESKVAAAIDHPNIVPIYDAGESEGVLYIAMRYVEGTDLKRLIEEEGTLDPARTVSIVIQLAAALDAAHGRDLIHRDVKPGNVLLVPRASPDAADHVYLTDFGLTRRSLSISGLTETGQLLGTVDYIAPEQITGGPLDPRVDVYALGCVIHECLTGHVPYERDNEVAVLWAHVQDTPPRVTDRRPDLPPAVDGVVTRAMARAADDRPETAGQVATELRTALGLAPSGAAAHVRTRRQRRRRRVVAGAVAAALLVGALITVVRPGRPTSVVPGPDTIALLDTGSSRFTEAIPVGSSPNGVAFGGGSPWVINERDKTFQRIDVASGAASVARAANGTPTAVAWGEGALWIANGFGSVGGSNASIVRVTPADMQTSQLIASAPAARSIVVAKASVWVTDEIRYRVVRYEALTGNLLDSIPLGRDAGPSSLAVGSGATGGLWVVNSLGGTVERIDWATGEVSQTIAVDGPSYLAADDSGIWVTSEPNDTVTHFDPDGTTISLLSHERGIPNGPSVVAMAAGSAWVASNIDHEVVQIDPKTDQVIESIPTAGIVSGMAEGDGGDLWMTLRAS